MKNFLTKIGNKICRKRRFPTGKHFLMPFAFIVMTLSQLAAQKFTIDGIKYNVTSKKAVKVSEIDKDVVKDQITLPPHVTYDGVQYLVTEIGKGAFYGCAGLTSISIPNSVTEIGMGAFSGCTGLTSVTIPNSVAVIGEMTFFGCSALTSVSIPNSVTSIGGETFGDCTGLISIKIPYSITEIGRKAFSGCTGLVSVTIPNSVTFIDTEAFGGCTGLTSIHIPNSVAKIGDGIFAGCGNLTSITVNAGNKNYIGENGVLFNKDKTFLYAYSGKQTEHYIIPNSVTAIGNCAFYGCKHLRSITIPNSVTEIGNFAFSGCTGLTSVVCNAGTPPRLGLYAYEHEILKNCVLHVPSGTKKLYETIDGWKNFGAVEEKQ